MNSARIIIVSLAGLALSCGSARADLVTEFDLDGNGSKESAFTSSFGEHLFVTTAKWTIKNGNKNKGYRVGLSGSSLSVNLEKAAAADKPSIISIEQATTLDAVQRKADITWKSGATIEQRSDTYLLAVDNHKSTLALVRCRVLSTSGLGDLAAQLVFLSGIENRVITYSIENKTDGKVTVDWTETGLRGEIAAGATLTSTRRAPNGATERKTRATFNLSGNGFAGEISSATVNYFSPANGVPAPGPVALIGLGSLIAARRRR